MSISGARAGSAIAGLAQAGDESTVVKRRVSPVPHGITFAPMEIADPDILREGKHTYLDWGIVPTSAPTVPMPEDLTPTVEITGAIRMPVLRLTGPAGGRPTFGMRAGSWEFRPRRGGLWARRFSDIANFLNGRELKVVLDDEKAFYYVGTVTARQWQIGDMTSTVTLDFAFYPYKLEITDSLQPWLWDPFNFYNGVIRKYGSLTVPASGADSMVLTVHGLEMPVVPDFYPATNHTGLLLTYAGVTHQLYAMKNGVVYDGVNPGLTDFTVPAGSSYDPETGRFTVSAVELGAGAHELTFTGNGTVSVSYRGGRL